MSRIYVGVGAKGRLVRKVQKALKACEFLKGNVDADYGPGTKKSVASFQEENDLEQTGYIDSATWLKLMGTDGPSMEERCLAVTPSIEGHGFTKAHGNWDGAWLTWGIIGFTLKYGMVDKIILNVHKTDPDCLTEAFGNKTDELLEVMRGDKNKKKEWADSISVGSRKYYIEDAWDKAFLKFGGMEKVQKAQINLAVENYYNPAKKTAEYFNLKTELGMGLCFDIHVQNGGVKSSARTQVKTKLAALTNPTEREVRELIAHAVADKCNPRFKEDVLSRKMAFATGKGTVHGYYYVMENWGLGEYPK